MVTVPLHQLNLLSDLVSGPVTGRLTYSTNKGHALNNVNDLAGDRVVVNPVIIDKTEVTASIDQLEDEILDLYPFCAVTRAFARKATVENVQVGKSTNFDYKYEINDTFLPSMYDESDQQTSIVCLPEKQDIGQKAPLPQDKGLQAHN